MQVAECLFPIFRFSSSLLMLGGSLCGGFVGVAEPPTEAKLPTLWLGVSVLGGSCGECGRWLPV